MLSRKRIGNVDLAISETCHFALYYISVKLVILSQCLVPIRPLGNDRKLNIVNWPIDQQDILCSPLIRRGLFTMLMCTHFILLSLDIPPYHFCLFSVNLSLSACLTNEKLDCYFLVYFDENK